MNPFAPENLTILCSDFSSALPSPPCPAELLHSQNLVHIRLRQEKALHVVRQDVLRQQRWHRCLPQQEDQSHLQALQKEAVPQKRWLWVFSVFVPLILLSLKSTVRKWLFQLQCDLQPFFVSKTCVWHCQSLHCRAMSLFFFLSVVWSQLTCFILENIFFK